MPWQLPVHEPLHSPEHFGGVFPVLYAGSVPGSLGMAVQGIEPVNPETTGLYRISVEAAPYR